MAVAEMIPGISLGVSGVVSSAMRRLNDMTIEGRSRNVQEVLRTLGYKGMFERKSCVGALTN